MEKRLIFALTLSIVIIVAFQYFTAKPITPPASQVSEQAVPAQEQIVKQVASQQFTPIVPEKEVIVETEKFVITFSNIGGAIKSIALKDYNHKGSQDYLKLVDGKNPSDYIFNLSSTTLPALNLSGYTMSQNKDGITYALLVDGWEISKQYVLYNTKRGIELRLFVKNVSSSEKDFSYRLVGGAGVTEASEHDNKLIEVTSKIDGKSVGYKRSKDATTINQGAVKWSALKNKYFSVIIKPEAMTRGQFYSHGESGELVMGIDSTTGSIAPGATAENKYLLYVGPSHIPALKEFDGELEETINYGFFGGISKALLVVLRFFYSIVHNWGIAIILLSILLNVLLFPLTFKSFSSMQKMQALQPQMEKLKKLHKDNPQKLNKEIMELYKKYKINPLGGCLPMLLQMPIFIALYQALMKSIELRGAKFLWVQDLSSPDAVGIPITLPIVGNSINILPLLMVAAMVVQQKMSTASMGSAVTDEQKQQQKMMLILMPVMFGFIFYNMPSGLVIYWIVNTVLTIVEQKAAMKNLVIEP